MGGGGVSRGGAGRGSLRRGDGTEVEESSEGRRWPRGGGAVRGGLPLTASNFSTRH